MDLSQDPVFLINKLAHTMSNELERRLRVYDVTTSQWKVLRLLGEQEGRSQVEIQEMLGLEGATVTGILQRMVRQGLAQRRIDPLDKRVQRVYLTEHSRALTLILDSVLGEVSAMALKGFTSDEQAFFLSLLSRAQHNCAEQ